MGFQPVFAEPCLWPVFRRDWNLVREKYDECNYMIETATSFGGPFVMLPESLISDWVEAMGEDPNPETGLYGEVCGRAAFMHKIDFKGHDVLRLGEEPLDLFWLPQDDGGLLVQWIAGESEESLLDFGKKMSAEGVSGETLEIEVTESRFSIQDSCGFDGDEQPKISLTLDLGRYEVQARYAEGESTVALVFIFKKAVSP